MVPAACGRSSIYMQQEETSEKAPEQAAVTNANYKAISKTGEEATKQKEVRDKLNMGVPIVFGTFLLYCNVVGQLPGLPSINQ